MNYTNSAINQAYQRNFVGQPKTNVKQSNNQENVSHSTHESNLSESDSSRTEQGALSAPSPISLENPGSPAGPGAPGGDTLLAPANVSSTHYKQLELPFEFDPLVVENMRQALIQYDLLIMSNPELKAKVEKYLEEKKAALIIP